MLEGQLVMFCSALVKNPPDSYANICPDLCLIYTDTHELHTDRLICKRLTPSPNMNPKFIAADLFIFVGGGGGVLARQIS